MAYLGSILSSACDEIRAAVGEPTLTGKLTNATLLPRIADAYSAVGTELQGLSERPLLAEFDYTLSPAASSFKLLLPATFQALRHIRFLDASGNFMGHVPPMRKYEMTPNNNGYRLNGPWLELNFAGTSTGITTVRIAYEPFGFMPVHYGVLASTGRTNTGSPSRGVLDIAESTSTVGLQDFRPNAYVGAWFRLYYTESAPSGYTGSTNYNTIERRCDSWAPTTHKITLDEELTFTDGGDWNYEILPTTQWDFWRAVILWTARSTLNLAGRLRRVQGATTEYTNTMRALRMRLSSADAFDPEGGDRRVARPYYLWQ